MLLRLIPTVRWQATTGEPRTIGPIRITPVARSLIIQSPHGGWVWTRPVAVLVERAGYIERVPVPDPTRRAQVALLGLTLFTLIRTIRVRRKRS